MAPWFRALVALAEDLGSVPSITVTPVPGDSVFSPDFQRHQAFMWCAHVHTDKTFMHVK